MIMVFIDLRTAQLFLYHPKQGVIERSKVQYQHRSLTMRRLERHNKIKYLGKL